MIDTKLPATHSNLIALVRKIASPETLELVANEWDTCPTAEKMDLVMNAYFTYEQEYLIVVINKTNTWGLSKDVLNSSGDCTEYLDLMNDNIIKEWHL